MHKKLKLQLNEVFDSPKPMKKEEFLRSFDFPKTSYTQFIMTQIGFIRKRVWAVTTIVMMLMIASSYMYTSDALLKVLWISSSLAPFIALVSITEVLRSSSCNMEEIEKSCKYSLEHIVLVRLGIVEVFNFVIFFIANFVLNRSIEIGMLRLGIYLVVPFLLTCILSLSVMNKMHQKEITYICAGVSGIVSLLNNIIVLQYTWLFTQKYTGAWIIIGIILFLGLIKEVKKMFIRMEELQWNSLLTV